MYQGQFTIYGCIYIFQLITRNLFELLSLTCWHFCFWNLHPLASFWTYLPLWTSTNVVLSSYTLVVLHLKIQVIERNWSSEHSHPLGESLCCEKSRCCRVLQQNYWDFWASSFTRKKSVSLHLCSSFSNLTYSNLSIPTCHHFLPNAWWWVWEWGVL